MVDTLIYIRYNTLLCNIYTFPIMFEQFTNMKLQPLIKTSVNIIIIHITWFLYKHKQPTGNPSPLKIFFVSTVSRIPDVLLVSFCRELTLKNNIKNKIIFLKNHTSAYSQMTNGKEEKYMTPIGYDIIYYSSFHNSTHVLSCNRDFYLCDF